MAAFRVEDAVIYQSESKGPIPAKVVAGPYPDGTYDLDCKQRVLPNRIVKRPNPAPVGGGCQCGGPSAPASAQGAVERCFYKSSTHGWIPARVLKHNIDDGTCDLDVKQRVVAANMIKIQEGLAVEYHSATVGGCIPARIVRVGPDSVDLDCKPEVDLTRIRPVVEPVPPMAAQVPENASVDRPLYKTIPAPPSPRRSHTSPGAKVDVPVSAAICSPSKADQYGASDVAARGYCPEASYAPQAAANTSAAASALEALRVAVGRGDQLALQAALRNAELQGVPRSELVGGERALRTLELRHAASGSDATVLEASLRVAIQAGVPQGEVQIAQMALQNLQTRGAQVHGAREALQKAEASGDPSAIKAALERAAGQLSNAELEAARGALQAAEAHSAWRAAAEGELKQALQAQNPKALRAALDHAKKVGLTQAEVQKAAELLHSLEMRSEAENNIREAAAHGDAPKLKTATAAAAHAGIPASRVEALLEELRGQATWHLQQAMHAGTAAQLRGAAEMAAALGIVSEELDMANHKLWALEAQPRALAELRRAKKGRSEEALHAAIEAAVAAGAPAQELESATACLKKLEAEAVLNRAKKALDDAIHAGDICALQDAIQRAGTCGVPEAEIMNASAKLRQLKAQAPARDELHRALSASNAAALRAAITYAEAAGIGENELGRARSSLQMLEHEQANRPPTAPNIVQPHVRQEERVQPGLKTQVFGAADNGDPDAGILTRVLGPAEDESHGLLTRVLGPAPSKDANILQRIFPSASSALNQCSGDKAMPSTMNPPIQPGTQPHLHVPPGGKCEPQTQPRLDVPVAGLPAASPSPYAYFSQSGSPSPVPPGAAGIDPPTQPRLAVPPQPQTQPRLPGTRELPPSQPRMFP